MGFSFAFACVPPLGTSCVPLGRKFFFDFLYNKIRKWFTVHCWAAPVVAMALRVGDWHPYLDGGFYDFVPRHLHFATSSSGPCYGSGGPDGLDSVQGHLGTLEFFEGSYGLCWENIHTGGHSWKQRFHMVHRHTILGDHF